MSPTMPHVILASGSPRRLEILRSHGIEPEIMLPVIDEDTLAASSSDLAPQDLVQTLAAHKARDVYERVKEVMGNTEHTVVLAADTLVYKDDVGALGKPTTHDEATAMLEALRNSSHQVFTGVALIDVATGKETELVDTTVVEFGDYTLEDMEHFIEEEPPFDKAGGYAIQGSWSRHVKGIEGDLENVIGLPFYRIKDALIS